MASIAAGSFDHDRGAPLAKIGLGGSRIGEAGESCGRDVVGARDLLGEGLRTLELRRRGARAERHDAGGLQRIDDAGNERPLGSHHHEFDRLAPAQVDDSPVIGGVDCDIGAVLGRARIARRDEEPGAEGALGERTRERVLAAAGADQKNVHGLALGHRGPAVQQAPGAPRRKPLNGGRKSA
jgi:hypothetical protein